MTVEIVTTDVKHAGQKRGISSFPQFSKDKSGLADAIKHYGGEEEGVAKVVSLMNSQIRIVEQGKVRSGGDPVKRAKSAVQKLNREEVAALLAELEAQ